MRGKEAYEFLLKNQEIIKSFTLADIEGGETKFIKNYTICELKKELFVDDYGKWIDEEWDVEEEYYGNNGYYDFILYSIQFKNEYENLVEEYIYGYVDRLKQSLNDVLKDDKEKKRLIQRKNNVLW